MSDSLGGQCLALCELLEELRRRAAKAAAGVALWERMALEESRLRRGRQVGLCREVLALRLAEVARWRRWHAALDDALGEERSQ